MEPTCPNTYEVRYLGTNRRIMREGFDDLAKAHLRAVETHGVVFDSAGNCVVDETEE